METFSCLKPVCGAKKKKKNRLKAIFMHSKCLHHFKKASHRPFCTVTNLNGKKTGKEVFHVELENKMWDVTFLVHFWISHSHFLRCYCLLLWLLLSPPLTHSAKALGTTQKTKYVCTIQITETRNIMCFFLFVFVCFFVFFVTYYICAEGLECTKNISNLLTHLLHIFKPLLASNSPNKPSARSFVASVSTAQEIHASVASPSIWLSALKALHHRTLEQCSCVLLGTKASLAVWWMSLVLVIARRAACANSYILWKTDNNLGPCFLGLEYNMNPV